MVDTRARGNLASGTEARQRQVKQLTAKDHVRISTQTKPMYYLSLVRRLGPVWSVGLTAAVFLTWRRAAQLPWAPIDNASIAILLVGLLGPAAFLVVVTRGTRNSARLQRAVVHADYERVLRLLPGHARALTKAGNTPAGVALSVKTYQAKALFRLGRQDEASRVMEELRCTEGVPEFNYLMSLGQFEHVGCNFESALEAYQRAAELKPDDYLPWLGQAELLANFLHRPAEAQVALNQLQSFVVTDETRNLMRLIEAGIAMDTRRPQDALRLIDEALPTLRWRARRTPAGRSTVALAYTLRAIACGMLNDRPGARWSFKRAAPLASRYASARDLFDRAKRAAGTER